MRKPMFKEMEGKSYLFGGREYCIESVTHLRHDIYKVVTNNGDIEVSKEEIVKDFKEILDEQTEDRRLSVYTGIKTEVQQMNDLTKILMENINKMNSDPKFIDQARAINETARSVIEIKKTQVEMAKIILGK